MSTTHQWSGDSIIDGNNNFDTKLSVTSKLYLGCYVIFTIRDENGVKLCLEGLSELQTKMTLLSASKTLSRWLISSRQKWQCILNILLFYSSMLQFILPVTTDKWKPKYVHIPKRTHCSLFTSNDFLISHTSLADNTSISIFNGQMDFFFELLTI